MAHNDALRRGAAYRRSGHVWLVRYLRSGIVHFENVETGARLKLTLDEWQAECAAGTLVPVDEAEAESAGSGKDGLRRGAYLQRLGFTWRVTLLKDGVVHLENVDTRETDRLSVDEWMQGCLNGTICHVAEPGEELDAKTAELLKVAFGDLPESMKASGVRKMQYVHAFQDPVDFYERKRPDVPVERRVLTRSLSAAKLRPFLKHVAEAIGEKDNQPGASTFIKWYNTWLRARSAGCTDARVLVNKYHLRGPQKRFMSPRVEQWLNDAIDEEWLRGTKPKKKKVFEALLRQVKVWNKANPTRPVAMLSERQVNRYIAQEVDKYVEVARREGRRKADEVFRMVGVAPEPENILDVVEVDHTRANVEVLDDYSDVRLGRPWVTVALDRYSRMALACHIHFDGQCLSSVMQALRQTMLPKDILKSLFPDLDLDYGCSGVPVAFFFDRGSDFDNDHIRDIQLQLDIRMDLEPVGCPETKGRIERFFGVMQDEVDHPLPGSCPSLLAEGERSELRGVATIRFSEFVRRTWLWLYGVYARSWHRGIKDTPLNRWKEGAARRLPRPPRPLKELDILFTRVEFCAVTRFGVRWNHLRWKSDELSVIKARPGFEGKVKVRIDEMDLGKAWAIDPATRQPIALEPAMPDYMNGLSLFQHRLVLCAADERFEGARDDETLIAARQMLDDEATALLDPGAREARKALGAVARYDGVGTRALGTAQPEPTLAPKEPEMPVPPAVTDPAPVAGDEGVPARNWKRKQIRKG